MMTEVVEVVRHPAGKLAYGLHFLRLPQLVLSLPQFLLRLFALADIDDEPVESMCVPSFNGTINNSTGNPTPSLRHVVVSRRRLSIGPSPVSVNLRK
jgi:hypothetical protein